MFPIRTDHSGIAPSVSYSNMSKEIPKNKICWVDGCNKEIKEWPYCDKHMKSKKVKMKVPGIKGFDNTPTKT